MLENQYAKGARMRANIIALRDKNPNITASEMSRILGRSRERIRQLLVLLDLPTKSERPIRVCQHCGNPLRIGSGSKKLFCNRECHSNSVRTLVPCDRCGELVEKRIAMLEYYFNKGYRHIFCDRVCFGSWAGNQWGWQTERGHKTIKGESRSTWLLEDQGGQSTTSKLLEASLRGIRRLRKL